MAQGTQQGSKNQGTAQQSQQDNDINAAIQHYADALNARSDISPEAKQRAIDNYSNRIGVVFENARRQQQAAGTASSQAGSSASRNQSGGQSGGQAGQQRFVSKHSGQQGSNGNGGKQAAQQDDGGMDELVNNYAEAINGRTDMSDADKEEAINKYRERLTTLKK